MPQLVLLVSLLMQGNVPVEAAGDAGAGKRTDCARPQAGDEILVCRRRDDEQFRLRPLPDKYVQPNRAAVKIGDSDLSAEAEQGRIDPQVMLRWRLPF